MLNSVRYASSGFKADHVTHFNAQMPGIGSAGDIFIQQNLGGIPAALGIAVLAVYVDGGVAKLQSTFVDLSLPGVDPDIFGFAVVGFHTAQVGQPQTAAAFDFRNHTAQGIRMGSQHQTVRGIFTAQIHQQTALGGDGGGKTEAFKLLLQMDYRLAGKTGRRIDAQYCGGLPPLFTISCQKF